MQFISILISSMAGKKENYLKQNITRALKSKVYLLHVQTKKAKKKKKKKKKNIN